MKNSGWLDGFTAGVFVTVMCLAVVGLATMGHVRAQGKPAPPAAAAPAPGVVPPMPAESAIALRDAVIAQAKLVIQLKDTIGTYNNLQGALNAQAKTLDDLKAAAIKAANLDPAKWDVDTETFKFIARPTPPAPAAPLDKPTGPPIVPAKKP